MLDFFAVSISYASILLVGIACVMVGLFLNVIHAEENSKSMFDNGSFCIVLSIVWYILDNLIYAYWGDF